MFCATLKDTHLIVFYQLNMEAVSTTNVCGYIGLQEMICLAIALNSCVWIFTEWNVLCRTSLALSFGLQYGNAFNV